MDMLIAEVTKHPIVAFYVSGFFGMLCHYTKKWFRGEYVGNLWAYLYADKPRATLAAIITYVVAAAGVASTGQIEGMKISALIGFGLVTGYTSDSVVNSTAQSR